MSAQKLYTPEVLALATSLHRYPIVGDVMPLRGKARSKSCGSVIELALATDPAGAITRVGVRAQACAVGQAAAALFAGGATGLDCERISTSANQIAGWLESGGEPPKWPGLAAIAAARDYPARHNAILLAWKAAIDALSQTRAPD